MQNMELKIHSSFPELLKLLYKPNIKLCFLVIEIRN
jgi:hypothetical protein